ncbi:hypothetical protein B5U98_31055 [Bosea sp. Tri-39]|nr:hypothetical protein BLM15_30515 [Bosea sp. Tri-49]RXT15562.1 hypothetical protein B5U98_31055 [Bosea sp. Tri-39]RXT34443.1 hypothetical protein B5U99_18050 [Bosea sp. Tri-54]
MARKLNSSLFESLGCLRVTQSSSPSGYTPEERAKELIEGFTTTLHSSSTAIVLANRDKALAQATLAFSAAEHDAIAAVAKMFDRLASSGVRTISTEKAAELIHEMLHEPEIPD